MTTWQERFAGEFGPSFFKSYDDATKLEAWIAEERKAVAREVLARIGNALIAQLKDIDAHHLVDVQNQLHEDYALDSSEA